MNKQDLTNKIIEEMPPISKNRAKQTLELIVSTISEALSKGERVTLSGFGTFYIAQRQARRGTNPRTKEPITIPAASIPKFRPGKDLNKIAK
ncbi:MAG: HU family DNA-binding protein [Candidatus Berkelbacteria bacterium]|nr:HU family DNA-binding protein [Candidatus Berkelbacteria bacterium]